MIFKTPEDIEEVRRLYWDEGLTLQQIADKLFCSVDAVHHCMIRNNIPRRPRGTMMFRTDKDVEEVRRLYWDEGLNASKIS